jgi:hypothetical protein
MTGDQNLALGMGRLRVWFNVSALTRLERMSYHGIVLAIALSLSGEAMAASRETIFHLAYTCPDHGPAAICMLGALPIGKPVALITDSDVISITPKEQFADKEAKPTEHAISTITIGYALQPVALQSGLAVEVPAAAVKIVAATEIQDEAIVRKVNAYLTKFFKGWATFHARTKVLRFSPVVSFANVSVVYSLLEEHISDAGECSTCRENTFLLRMGKDIIDLYQTERSTDLTTPICWKLRLSFEIFGRLHVYSGGFRCETDVDFAFVHDLSGLTPKLVMSY